jgi:surface protein
MKRIISIIMVTLLTVVSAFANIAEGVSGDCQWVIDNDGNLTISSESYDIADLGTWEGDSAPWSNYRESITTVAFTSPVNAKTCAYMFKGCTNLNAVYLDNFYTNEVTDMSFMFADCTSLEVIEIDMAMSVQDDMTQSRGNFLTSNVTNMASMFEGCKSLQSFYLQNLDIHSVKNFSNMFAGCSSLEDMNLTEIKNANDSSLTAINDFE